MATPKLRFKGFLDPWKNVKLTDITKILNGLTYSPKDKRDQGTLVIRSSNVKNGMIVNADNVIVDDSVVNSANVKNGDVVVVVRNGSKKLIGKHAKIDHEMKNTVVGAFMSLLRSENGNFLNALLDTREFKKRVHESLGATINQITKNDFSLMKMSNPISSQEISLIGDYMALIDRLIKLQGNKLDALKRVKNSYLQKMFINTSESKPRLRFKGFTDDWHSVKIGEIGTVITGNTPTKNDLNNYSDNGYTWVTPTDIRNNVNYVYDSGTTLSEKGFKLSRSVPANSLLITCIASIGKNAIAGKGVSFNQQINALIPGDGYDPYFLYCLSIYWSRDMERLASSSSLKMINKTDFSNIKTKVPSLMEQKKIGSFMYSVDNSIKLQGDKLERLQELKKGYLQKLFA